MLLHWLGWTLVVVPGMKNDACIVESEHIVLFSDRLTPERRSRLGSRLLTPVLEVHSQEGRAIERA